jgi:hypothetical protein
VVQLPRVLAALGIESDALGPGAARVVTAVVGDVVGDASDSAADAVGGREVAIAGQISAERRCFQADAAFLPWASPGRQSPMGLASVRIKNPARA